MNYLRRIIVAVALLAGAMAIGPLPASAATVVTYPAPSGAPGTGQYSVQVAGRPSFVHPTGLGAFTNFSFGGGPVTVTVTTSKDSRTPVLRPRDAAVGVTRVAARTFRFTIPVAGSYSFEIDPDTDGYPPLFLFANPLETNPPTGDTATTKYVGPGYWTVNSSGQIVPGSTGVAGTYSVAPGTRLYLAGGAILRGKIRIGSDSEGGAGADGTAVTGRGIVDSTAVVDHGRPLRINNSTGVTIDGPIFLGQKHWGVVARKSQQVTLRNIKVINWRDDDDTGTPDGIDVVASSNVEVDGAFVRSYDDGIAIKSSMSDDTWMGPTSQIYVHDSVVFNGRAGNGLEIGRESGASISGVFYENVDIIHKLARSDPYARDAISIFVRDEGDVRDVNYTDVRVEECQERYLGFEVTGPGSLTGVDVTDVTFAGAPRALPTVITGNPNGALDDVAFRGLRFNGGSTLVTRASQLTFVTNQYATRVTFRP
ncbi:glycosyl hydrolase family 28 protein [Cryptosporangium arvum]|uniref:Endopolygalacturonase n=1 Tax=Cryptosporangium arvum DSM 44712 TaxID=927661 RepID=A0A010ZPW0_9ACTN|nr:glycosyl hydrolase family 28 protein [Cryptosporangium arvum]EXG80714.1 endopolygalacturonase [Cryptosporangium arvum DSM 44712]